jgi:hypothetical protein
MSKETIETVLTRAMDDESFAELLFTNADQALAGYDLTQEELEAFKKMPREELDKYAKASPEERKSLGVGGVFTIYRAAG